MAPLYNSLDWLTCGAWWTLQRRALDHIQEGNTNNNQGGRGRILEVGFGPGKLFVELAKLHPVSLDGIDLAEGMCSYTTRHRMQKAGFSRSNSTIIRGSVHDIMPYTDGSFDTVVTTFFL